MTAPAVSVVVLTLNSERYIGRCLRSLARQTLEDFEVIVVDAGSKDRTREMVAEFDERFRWFELVGSDMGAARNYGMRQSRGRYLTFLDSDDFYLGDKLSRQVAELETNPRIDVTFCTAWHFRTGKPDRIGTKRVDALPRSLRDFVAGHNHNLNTMCMRRSLWDVGFAFGEGDRGRYGEEWRLQLSLAQRGVPMGIRTEPLVVAEMRPDSHTVWSRQWIMKTQAIEELERVAAFLTPEQRSHIDVGTIIDAFRGKLVVALLLDGRKKEARQVAGLVSDPRRARRAKLLAAGCTALPRRLLAGVLRGLWLWRQDLSFEWQKTPETLLDEFSILRSASGKPQRQGDVSDMHIPRTVSRS